jgi:peroxiredoxin
MAWAIYQGRLPAVAGWTCVFNDLIWWVPFLAALWYAYKINSAPTVKGEGDFDQSIHGTRSQHGRTLADISNDKPVLITFLRHSGCTFCREALADVAQARQKIEAKGLRLAFVHMSSESEGAPLFESYELGDVDRFSDPERRLYQAFDLQRGRASQLLGPTIWWRGFLAAIVARHGFGRIQGDGFQMPGVFVLYQGRIIASYRHATAADRPDYEQLAMSEACSVNRAAATDSSVGA